MIRRKLNKIAKDTNLFLKRFITKQKKTNLIVAMKYGLFSGGKKIRSKILIDVGSLFKLDYKVLIIIGAAVECIHAYSLIHDDLPCMDDDSIRRGKPAAHIKFDFFCLAINLLKNKFVSFAILFNFLCIIFLVNLRYLLFCFLIYFFNVHLKFFLNYII